MKNVLIADDHGVVRMAVRILLESAGFHVVDEVSSGFDVLECAWRKKPDLIILDLDLPGMDGISVLDRLCRDKGSKVIVYSALSAGQYAARCSRAGASAFVSKEDDVARLMATINMVQAGYTIFPAVEHSGVENPLPGETETDVVESLSGREVAVLRYLARGYKNKEIAREMSISEKTSSTYKSRLLAKLKFTNGVALAEFAKRNDFI